MPVLWQHDETRNYMYRLTYRRRNMSLHTLALFSLSLSRSGRWVHAHTHAGFRLDGALKDECQFHVKSLSPLLFLYAWVWDSSFPLLTEPRAHLHSLTWQARKYRYNMYTYTNWTWRLPEISRMLMQSLKKNGIIQYRYTCLHVFTLIHIYIFIYLHSYGWPSTGSSCTSMRGW